MKAVAIVFLFVFARGVLDPARAEDKTPGFYERKAEGWFWYAVEAEESAPEEEERPAIPPAATQTPSAPFSAAWLRVNLPKYLDLAWNEPSVENLRAFLYLQRFTIDRAEQFSGAARRAVIGDPLLDEISRRPTASFASWQVDRDAGAARERLLEDLARRVGLFFFFRSDDRYSALEAPLIELLGREEGFAVVAVSVDGKALADGHFPAFKSDRGQARRLGVTTLPAVFLASRDGRFSAVGQGVMSLPQLKNRILVAARRENWLSAARFAAARPLLDGAVNLGEHLGAASGAGVKTDGGADGFVAPRRLIRYLRSTLATDARGENRDDRR